MSNINFKRTFVKGVSTPVINATINSVEDLKDFVRKDYSHLSVFNKRLNIDHKLLLDNEEVILEELKEYYSVYNHYELNLECLPVCALEGPEQYSIIRNMSKTIQSYNNRILKDTKLAIVIYNQILSLMDMVIKECCSRTPEEFDSKGLDPEWYGLGDNLIAVYDSSYISGKITVKGYASVEILDSNVLKVWTLGIKEKYRGSGVFNKLIKGILEYATINKCSTISIATDTSEFNNMNYILKKYKFKLIRVSYRN